MSDNFFVRCGRKELGDNHLRLMVLGVILLLSHVLGNIAQAEQLSWAKQAGGTKADIGVSIAADGGGYSYVTGSYSDTATFGDGNSQVTFTNLGGTHLFVAKYDTGGGLVWVKDARARFDEYHNIMVLGVSIALDANGNIYVTGGFWDTATFGPGEATETSITSAGSSDIFVAKYNSGGGLVWVKQGGGASTEFGRSIAVDENGDSYVTGYFLGTVTFGEAGTTQTTITSGGAYAIFVAKYDGDGGLVWVKQAGGETSENSADATGIALDGSGNVYVTGEFLYTATFGPGEATETTLVSGASNDADLFVAKYNSGGGLVWAKRAGAYGAHERGQGIGLDGSGNIYVVGNFNGTTVFGPGEPNETTLACDCDSSDTTFFDLFVAKYNSGGGLVWAKRAGGPGSDDGRSIAVDDNGNSYVSGTFYGTATFGSGELSETTLSAGSPDIGDLFVAKYDSGGGLVWAKQAEGTSPFGISGNGVALDGSGNVYVTGQFGDTATIGPGEPNATTLVSAGSLDLFVAKYVYSSGETPAGNNISVIPEDPNPVVPGVKIKVEFFEVTDSGVTTVTSSQSGTPPPTGFSLGDPPVSFDIKTTAKFEGLIKICIDYTGISFPNESLLRLYHQAVEGNWENVTISLDTSKDIICGVVSSLSPFAVFEATYQFVGFFSPVQTGDGTVNLAKAGSVIPLKWQLLDKQGAFITDTKVVTGIYTEKIACSNSALLNDIDETLSSGSSGLHYDFTSNQYVYAWKTDKKWAGKCFRLKLELFKSYKYSADFQMW